MTQDERWMAKYNEVVELIKSNKRNPLRHRIEEHDMLNWLKANRKVMNTGEMKPERVDKFSPSQAPLGKSCIYQAAFDFLFLLLFFFGISVKFSRFYLEVMKIISIFAIGKGC